MRIYIAGPMTDHGDDYNFPAFHAAARAWRDAGWEVFNPAESFDGETDLPYRVYVNHDLEELQACQAIAMLEGWDEPSARGSVWERAVALMLGLREYEASNPVAPPKPETVLDEAMRVVDGPRQSDYGHPRDNHGITAAMFSAYLGIPVSAEQVCILNILQKASRSKHKVTRDTLIDIAGYARNIEMIGESK